MQLTEIHVPGKRKRSMTKDAIESRKEFKREPGRPFSIKPPKPVIPITDPRGRESRQRTLKRMKTKNKMSFLERLPVELLDTVFLYCLNLELPRSSPILAGKLSSQNIYLRLTLIAFGPTWDQQDLSSKELANPVLQSAVLRCRWATLEQILRVKDSWLQKHTRTFEPKYFMESARSPLPIDMMATRNFEDDFEAFRSFINSMKDVPFQEKIDFGIQQDVDEGTEIPESLLSGPWDKEKVRYLFWFLKSGAKLNWHTSVTGEIAQDGMRDAIREGNIEAINILLWIGIGPKLNVDTLIYAISHGGGNKLATVYQILREFPPLGYRDLVKLRTELSSMRDEAVWGKRPDELIFIKAVADHPTIKDSLGSY